MSEPYSKTKHFIFETQHEESTILSALKEYMDTAKWFDKELTTDPNDPNYRCMELTVEGFIKEIEDAPCGCGTCKAYAKGELTL